MESISGIIQSREEQLSTITLLIGNLLHESPVMNNTSMRERVVRIGDLVAVTKPDLLNTREFDQFREGICSILAASVDPMGRRKSMVRLFADDYLRMNGYFAYYHGEQNSDSNSGNYVRYNVEQRAMPIQLLPSIPQYPHKKRADTFEKRINTLAEAIAVFTDPKSFHEQRIIVNNPVSLHEYDLLLNQVESFPSDMDRYLVVPVNVYSKQVLFAMINARIITLDDEDYSLVHSYTRETPSMYMNCVKDLLRLVVLFGTKNPKIPLQFMKFIEEKYRYKSLSQPIAKNASELTSEAGNLLWVRKGDNLDRGTKRQLRRTRLFSHNFNRERAYKKFISNYRHLLPSEGTQRLTHLVSSGTAANEVVVNLLSTNFLARKGEVTDGWYFESSLKGEQREAVLEGGEDPLICNYLCLYGFGRTSFCGKDSFDRDLEKIQNRVRSSGQNEVIVIDMTVNPLFNLYELLEKDVRDKVTVIKTISLTKYQKDSKGFFGLVDIDYPERIGLTDEMLRNVITDMNVELSDSSLQQFPLVTKANMNKYLQNRQINIARILEECKKYGVADRVCVPEASAPYIVITSSKDLWMSAKTPFADTFGFSYFTHVGLPGDKGQHRIAIGYKVDPEGCKVVAEDIARVCGVL